MFKQITKDNWLLYAQKHYDNPTFETEKEFWDDIKRLNISKGYSENMKQLVL